MIRFERPKLAVIKVGSSSLRGVDGRLDVDQVASISGQVADARRRGTQIVVVTSGAVAAGMGSLGLRSRPSDLPTLQATAAIGQGDLIQAYQRVLAAHELVAGQILLSQDDFIHRPRYLNARTTIHRVLELGAVPIINENDAVATDEFSYGDNDHLASLVASMLEAQLLLLLSDVEGLYDADPRTRPDAKLIRTVDSIEALDPGSIGGVGSFVGSGGMRSKVDAAQVAVRSAAHAVVADARAPDIVERALAGAPVGTWFVARAQRAEARRLWIGFALTAHGRIHIDEGAADALRRRGVSLLGVGITGADGTFMAGDAVEVVDEQGRAVARGLSNYDVDDVVRLAGLATADAAERFGVGYAREVIHRDDLVLLN